jgi:hypothetical protein
MVQDTAGGTVEDTVARAPDVTIPETPTLDPRRVPPRIDVPALTALLPGPEMLRAPEPVG